MKIEYVAKEWGISSRTVYRLVERGLLPAEIITVSIPQECYDIAVITVSRVSEMLKQKRKSKKKTTTLIREYLSILARGMIDGRYCLCNKTGLG
jgi:stalled ribosome rescue protein Dom34